jgi:pyrroloquinoline-quinone synthase
VPLFQRLETVRERWNVLDHPFYRRWSAGELSRDELAFYAGEYRHAVSALAEAFGDAARGAVPEQGFDPSVRAELEEHAAEEAEHVPLWQEFERAMGGDPGRAPRPETEECVRAWTSGEDTLERLVATWVVESGQPEIAQTKLAGLIEHYGMDEGPATEYFRLHSELDFEHAEHTRELIEEHLADVDLERLLVVAERVLKGNWELLDGVEREHGRLPDA